MKSGKKVAMLVIICLYSAWQPAAARIEETGGNAGDKADTINVGINVELSGGVPAMALCQRWCSVGNRGN